MQRQLFKSHSSSSRVELICCDWSNLLNNINLHTLRSFSFVQPGVAAYCHSPGHLSPPLHCTSHISSLRFFLSFKYLNCTLWDAHTCIQNEFIVWKTAIMKTASCKAMLWECMCVTVIPQRTRVVEAEKKVRACSLLGTSAKFFNCNNNNGTPWWRISPPAGDCFNLFSSASDYRNNVSILKSAFPGSSHVRSLLSVKVGIGKVFDDWSHTDPRQTHTPCSLLRSKLEFQWVTLTCNLSVPLPVLCFSWPECGFVKEY